jgi:hypothetical protein
MKQFRAVRTKEEVQKLQNVFIYKILNGRYICFCKATPYVVDSEICRSTTIRKHTVGFHGNNVEFNNITKN